LFRADFVKIGLISDTHLSEHRRELPCEVPVVFAKVDAILHAGDLVRLHVIDQLSRIAPTEAVRGNMDHAECGGLPTKRIVDAAGVKIGFCHGRGGPGGIVARVLARFHEDDVQVIVFGHSHRPIIEGRGGILLINPGSASDSRFGPYPSVGLLEIEDGRPRAEIIRISL